MIIIINGPLGIGKTEVSWKLLEHFERAVMLDGDYIGAVQPFDIYDPQRIEYLYQTIHHLVAFHLERGGYRNYVVNYVFEEPESLARLRHLLYELDEQVYAFRLTCSPQEMERRIRRRARGLPPEPGRVKWELNRFRELTAIQEEAAKRGDMGIVVDTTGLNVAQVADGIWGTIHEEIALAPYNPDWPALFEAEKARLQQALGKLALAFHHIGSTAVEGLEAKPIIDIMMEVRRLEDAQECIAPLLALGYTFIDHPENIDRRFFRKGQPRTHHLHIVEQSSQTLFDHLKFRDALRGDPALKERYRQLKATLTVQYRYERAAYTKNKTAFVRSVLDVSP